MIRCELQNGQSFGITNVMQVKMEGMHSLNTSAENNPFCQEMREQKGNICASCYSKSSERRFKNCLNAWTNNLHVLSENLLKRKEIPTIEQDIFRFQAHGDLVNRTHYKNLVSIAEANPQTVFAMWTKHLGVIFRGGLIKLHNLIYIYSTPKLNELNPTLPKGFDRAFTIYSKPFIKENDVEINCAKKCADCRLCYEHNNVVFVNELIKNGR